MSETTGIQVATEAPATDDIQDGLALEETGDAAAVNGAATVGDAPGEELSDEACAAGGQPGDAYGDEHCCVDDP